MLNVGEHHGIAALIGSALRGTTEGASMPDCMARVIINTDVEALDCSGEGRLPSLSFLLAAVVTIDSGAVALAATRCGRRRCRRTSAAGRLLPPTGGASGRPDGQGPSIPCLEFGHDRICQLRRIRRFERN